MQELFKDPTFWASLTAIITVIIVLSFPLHAALKNRKSSYEPAFAPKQCPPTLSDVAMERIKKDVERERKARFKRQREELAPEIFLVLLRNRTGQGEAALVSTSIMLADALIQEIRETEVPDKIKPEMPPRPNSRLIKDTRL